MVAEPRRPLGWKKLLGFTALALLGFLLGIEVLLRLLGMAGLPDRSATWFGDQILRYSILEEQHDPRRGLSWLKPMQASHPQPFARESAPGTRRIAVLGGSAVHGYGFSEAGAFPRKLQRLLDELAPEQRFEVINLGTIAWSSQQLLWGAKQLWDYGDWDLLIIYSGHNELLELASWKSYLSPAAHRRYTRALLWRERLQNSRLLEVIRRIALAVRGPEGTNSQESAEDSASRNIEPSLDPAPNDRGQLRDAIPAAERAQMGPLEWRYAARTYRHNIGRVVELARSHGASVILLKPAPNDLHDPARFPSPFGPNSDYERLFATFEGRFPAGDATLGEDLRWALGQQPDPRVWFWYATWLRKEGRFAEARVAYDEARQRAEYPNRVIPKVSEAIASMAGEPGVLGVIDVEAAFRAEDEHGFIGYDLVSDHCHPSRDGHWLIAGLLADFLVDANVLRAAPGAVAPMLAQHRREDAAQREPDLSVDRWLGTPWEDGRPIRYPDPQNDARAFFDELEQRVLAAPSPKRWIEVGDARYNRSDLPGALSAWERAAEIDPGACVALGNVALALEAVHGQGAARAREAAEGCREGAR